MKFTETKLKGAFIVNPEPVQDERGFFARTWCRDEFAAHGLNSALAQCSISVNKRRGTLRGMHYQVTPHEETKLVRCLRGAIYDVIVDLRPEAPTFKRWLAVELRAADPRMLYVPERVAHGFLTLEDDTEVFYQITGVYSKDHAKGVRWNDPAFAIEWPEEIRVISERDRSYPDYQ